MSVPIMTLLSMQGWPWLLLVSVLLAGLYLLLKGGDWLCRGAVSLALKLNISNVIVGLTIVSIATSAPELFTSLAAIWKGTPDLAMGNIIGSNAANVGLIMGVAALIYPLSVHNRLIRWELPILIIATILFWIILANGSGISRWDGIVLLVLTLLYLALVVRTARSKLIGEELEDEIVDSDDHWIMASLLIIGGALLLWLGAEFLVEASVTIAYRMGVSDAMIGLTLVAIGTSLPELGTTVVAAIKRQSGIIIGNIIGSNLFNMLLIGGLAGVLAPFSIQPNILSWELPMMLVITLLFAWFVFTQRTVTRKEGLFLLIFYSLFLIISCLSQSDVL